MRNERYRVTQAEAVRLFERADVVHLATLADDGRPIHRTLHGVVVGDGVVWHGAPKGEKSTVVGRFGVMSCERIIANIPSHFIDPERACPATTYYESAQAAGIIEVLDDVHEKAAALQALMQRFQPEGGHAPITADDPRYEAAVRNLSLWRVPFTELVGKVKLGQNKKPDEMARIVASLWARGGAGDLEAIERLLVANPATPTPTFLAGPNGVRLSVVLRDGDVAQAVEFLRDAYWNLEVTDDVIARAHLASNAWVGARDSSGRLIGTARAVSDGAKHAWVYDVAVDPAWRGRGIGRSILGTLLDHPNVRRAGRVHLRTLDAQDFYRSFGFEVRERSGPTAGSELMSIVRAA